MKKLVIIIYLCSFTIYSQNYSAGITSLNFFPSSQYMDQWCWAASIQMVYNYYGININQLDIVARTFGVDQQGNLINSAASNQQISNSLVGGIDRNGTNFQVTSRYYPGVPIPSELIKELNNQHPVIIAHRSSPTTGHAVVLTACEYIATPTGPIITKLIVRDPWPDQNNIRNKGRIEYTGTDLVSRITGFWIIRIF